MHQPVLAASPPRSGPNGSGTATEGAFLSYSVNNEPRVVLFPLMDSEKQQQGSNGDARRIQEKAAISLLSSSGSVSVASITGTTTSSTVSSLIHARRQLHQKYSHATFSSATGREIEDLKRRLEVIKKRRASQKIPTGSSNSNQHHHHHQYSNHLDDHGVPSLPLPGPLSTAASFSSSTPSSLLLDESYRRQKRTISGSRRNQRSVPSTPPTRRNRRSHTYVSPSSSSESSSSSSVSYQDNLTAALIVPSQGVEDSNDYNNTKKNQGTNKKGTKSQNYGKRTKEPASPSRSPSWRSRRFLSSTNYNNDQYDGAHELPSLEHIPADSAQVEAAHDVVTSASINNSPPRRNKNNNSNSKSKSSTAWLDRLDKLVCRGHNDNNTNNSIMTSSSPRIRTSSTFPGNNPQSSHDHYSYNNNNNNNSNKKITARYSNLIPQEHEHNCHPYTTDNHEHAWITSVDGTYQLVPRGQAYSEIGGSSSDDDYYAKNGDFHPDFHHHYRNHKKRNHRSSSSSCFVLPQRHTPWYVRPVVSEVLPDAGEHIMDIVIFKTINNSSSSSSPSSPSKDPVDNPEIEKEDENSI